MISTVGRRSTYGGLGGGVGSGLPRKKPTSTLTSEEIDSKCKIVLAEIDRCKTTEKYIESSVLHSVPQTFVPNELRVDLEAELDRLLTEQILREECLPATTASATERLEDNASTAHDPDVCLACTGHCTWNPVCDANILSQRRKELYRELKSCEKSTAKTVQSIVARTAHNGGETKFTRKDLIIELSDEIHEIDSRLKLARIDEELHRTFACTNESVTIRSIHGYDMTVKRRDGILALEHEHNRHVAGLVSREIVDKILEW